MTDVEIEYCVPCGHLDRAQQLQGALLEEFGQRLDGVRLDTGDSGVFEVRVDGETVFDIDEESYDTDSIVERVAGSRSPTPSPTDLPAVFRLEASERLIPPTLCVGAWSTYSPAKKGNSPRPSSSRRR